MNKINCLVIVGSLFSTIFGMDEKKHNSSSPRSIRIVNKQESEDFLARRNSSGSAKDSPRNSPRHSSRSRLVATPEFPFGVIDGKVIPSEKSCTK